MTTVSFELPEAHKLLMSRAKRLMTYLLNQPNVMGVEARGSLARGCSTLASDLTVAVIVDVQTAERWARLVIEQLEVMKDGEYSLACIRDECALRVLGVSHEDLMHAANSFAQERDIFLLPPDWHVHELASLWQDIDPSFAQNFM